MKTLLILRHAKAQPDAPNGDKARILTDRGKRNAASMGKLLSRIAPSIDSVVTSDASRALQTAQIASKAAGYSGTLTLEPDIYGGYLDDLLDVVCALPDSSACVLIVGHNPGFEELAAALSEPGTPPPRLPTAGLAHLEFDIPKWRNVREGSGRLRAVHIPKELPED